MSGSVPSSKGEIELPTSLLREQKIFVSRFLRVLLNGKGKSQFIVTLSEVMLDNIREMIAAEKTFWIEVVTSDIRIIHKEKEQKEKETKYKLARIL